jgi:hypothetical protein
MKTICQSGLTGYQCNLQDNYDDYEQFVHFSRMYNLHGRLGYRTPMAAWKANPVIQGSVEPSDFRKI